jgi:hypothetical protein
VALIFCIAEDRKTEEGSLRLALLSLLRHQPEATVYLYRPSPTEDFLQWLQLRPQVKLISEWPGTSGWNVKPQALLGVLDRGHDHAIWLDSDTIITRPLDHFFAGLSAETLVVTEDMATAYPQGTAVRTRGWGLAVGREFPVTMNSCLLRVTPAHTSLLRRWNELLGRADYLAAQKLPTYERPPHFYGDQDVLNAVAGSQEFAAIPVHYLRRGMDVAHTGGARTYTLRERIRGMFQPAPPVLHSQWAKPWIALNPNSKELSGRFWVFHRVILEASPYMAVARQYRDVIGGDTAWLAYASMAGLFVRALGFGHVPLQGLPLTLIATMNARLDKLRQD